MLLWLLWWVSIFVVCYCSLVFEDLSSGWIILRCVFLGNLVSAFSVCFLWFGVFFLRICS